MATSNHTPGPWKLAAERVYEACMDVAAALSKAFTAAERETLSEAFQDY